MRIYKTKIFRRFQRKEALADADLAEAIARAERGLIDAELGRGLIKQRVARPGQARSGGYRTIVAYRVGHRAFFIFGFAKSGQANIPPGDEARLAVIGATLMSLSDRGLQAVMANDELWEIDCD